MHRTQILLQAETEGLAWTDERLTAALSGRSKTVAHVRQRRALPPVPELLAGEQETQSLALRPGPLTTGSAHWSLRLWARRGAVLPAKAIPQLTPFRCVVGLARRA